MIDSDISLFDRAHAAGWRACSTTFQTGDTTQRIGRTMVGLTTDRVILRRFNATQCVAVPHRIAQVVVTGLFFSAQFTQHPLTIQMRLASDHLVRELEVRHLPGNGQPGFVVIGGLGFLQRLAL